MIRFIGLLVFSNVQCVRSLSLDCSSTECPSSYLNNKSCNTSCMIKQCNYDSIASFSDSFSTLTQGDCLEECLVHCTQDQLKNTVCDADCDVPECGFDLGTCGVCASGCYENMLGDGKCDPDCDTLLCRHDVNDCGWCSKGCYKEMLNDGICQEACKTSECNFDSSDCYIECSPGCTMELLYNDICNDICNTLACSYDDWNCPCSKECTKEIRGSYTCESACNNKECNWHEGKCGDCNSGCYNSMIGNGVCDPACLTSECNYDLTDCGCAPGCPYEAYKSYISGMDYCSQSCMHVNCDTYTPVKNCKNTNEKKRNFYYQMMNSDFDVQFEVNRCVESDRDCTAQILDNALKGICPVNGCMTEECMNLQPYCNSPPTCSGCLKCDNSGKCYECALKKFQYFTRCLSVCPKGFKDVKLSFMQEKVCLEDSSVSSRTKPYEVYVSNNGATSGTGTKDNPYKSLTTALMSISTSYTKVLLLSGTYDLDLITIQTDVAQDPKDPLKRINDIKLQQLTITTAFCTDYPTVKDCASERATIKPKNLVKLTLNAQTFTFKDLNFDGSFLVCSNLSNQDKAHCNCSGEKCQYCPRVIQLESGDQSIHLDDRYKRIPQNTPIAYNCSPFDNFNFIESISNSDIFITNVKFSNFRTGHNSLIIVEDSNLYLNNVDFERISCGARDFEAVIYIDNHSDDYRYFEYNSGSVKYLNDGYELLSDTELSGFLYSSEVQSVKIDSVEFKYNISYCGKNISKEKGFGALIVTENIKDVVQLSNITVENNYMNEGLLYIAFENIKYETIDMEYEIFYHTNVILSNISILNSTTKNSMISYISDLLLHSIYIENLQIHHSVSLTKPMLMFKYSPLLKDTEKTGGEEMIINNVSDYYALPSRNFKINGLNADGCYFNKNFLSLYNIANVQFLEFSINNSGDLYPSTGGALANTLTLDSFKDMNLYIQYGFQEWIQFECENILYLQGIYEFIWVGGTFSGNNCKSILASTALVINSSEGAVYIQSVTFSDITSWSFYSNSIYITNHDFSIIYINDCKFQNLMSSGVAASVFLTGVYGVEITSSIFENISNSGSTVSIEGAYVVVKYCQFKNVQSNSSSGGIDYVHVRYDELESKLHIESSTFDRCLTPNGYGCIHIENDLSSEMIDMLLNDLVFSDCLGLTSAVFIARNINFKSGVISNVTIKSSYSKKSAPIHTEHEAGTLTISNASFINNRGKICAIYTYFITDGNLVSLENITADFNSCDGSTIYLSSIVSGTVATSKNLTVKNSTGTGLELVNIDFYGLQSAFYNNTVAILIDAEANGKFDILEIANNIDESEYSGIQIKNEGFLYCNQCNIHNNRGAEGTAIRAEQNSYFELIDSTIQDNVSASSSSAIYIMGCSSYNSTLINTVISGNTSGKDLVISILKGNLLLYNCIITENKSITGDPSIQLYSSYILFSNCTLSNQQFESLGFIYTPSSSNVIASNSRFYNIQSKAIGAVVSMVTSIFLAVDCKFENITTINTGAIVAASTFSEVIIHNSVFKNIEAELYGGLFLFIDSTAILTQIHATSFTKNGIFGSNMQKLVIDKSYFGNGSGDNGAAIYCNSCTEVLIYNTVFEDNTATSSGGAINLYGEAYSWSDFKTYEINSCQFKRNKSSKGGSIYINQSAANITHCLFEENTANLIGGGVSLECSDPSVCKYYIKDSNFTNNNSVIQGGAISWDDKKPTLENITFINNESTYGNDIASYPIMIYYFVDGELIPYQRRLQTSELSPIAYKISDAVPGQKLSFEIKLALVDQYGSINYSDNSTSAEISEVDVTTTVLSGTTKVIAQVGVYTFNDLTIQFVPGGTTYLEVTSGAIDTKKQESSGDTIEYYDTVFIEVTFRMCVTGETDLGRECKVCESGTYSLDPSSSCTECPSEATCLGDFTMYPKSGFWRTDKFTDVFYECFNPDACLGSNNRTSFTGKCAEGYLGNLCQTCDNGYSRTSENQCGSCPEPTINAIRLIGILILVIIVCVVMVKTTFNSAYVPSSLHSIYIKIFTNYLQLVMITTQFQLEWPELVLELFSIQKQSGTVTDQLFSIDCYLTNESSKATDDVYFQKLIVLALVPLILFLISFVFWGILAQKHKNRTYLRKEMIATMVILFFLVHPNITRASFAVFSCMNIEGKGYYLLDNLDIECWNGKHYLYSMSLALPCIIVWVLGTPALVLYYMYKHKLQLLEIDNKLRFGFLYNGYRNKTFYWEFVILYRKILIISISVFLSTVSIGIQALSALLILIGSLYMQMKTRPFTHKSLNIMEARGILAANVTIYCGLFYLTGDLDEGTKYFFFFAIVSVNIYFISYWFYYLFQEGWKIVKKKIGFLRRKFDHEDGYEIEFLVESHQSKQTILCSDQIRNTLIAFSPTPDLSNTHIPESINDLFNDYLRKSRPDNFSEIAEPSFISSPKSVEDELDLAMSENFDNIFNCSKISLDIKQIGFDDEDSESIADEID